MFKKCLEIDPGNRPDVAGVRKCIWDMLIKPPYDVLGTSEVAIDKSSASFCLILGELCQFPQKSSKLKRECELQGKLDGDVPNFVQDGKKTPNGDFGGSSKEMAEVKDIRGHLDCITGLAVGGVNPYFIVLYIYHSQLSSLVQLISCAWMSQNVRLKFWM